MISTSAIILTLVAASLSEPISPNLARRCGLPSCTTVGNPPDVNSIGDISGNVIPGPFGSSGQPGSIPGLFVSSGLPGSGPGCLNQNGAVNAAIGNNINCFNSNTAGPVPFSQMGAGVGGADSSPGPVGFGGGASPPGLFDENQGAGMLPPFSTPGVQVGNGFQGQPGFNPLAPNTFGSAGVGGGASCANQVGLINLQALNSINCGNGRPALAGISLKDHHSEKKA